jgi:hypothetical protein
MAKPTKGLWTISLVASWCGTRGEIVGWAGGSVLRERRAMGAEGQAEREGLSRKNVFGGPCWRFVPSFRPLVLPICLIGPTICRFIPPNPHFGPTHLRIVPPLWHFVPPLARFGPTLGRFVPPISHGGPPKRDFQPPIPEFIPPLWWIVVPIYHSVPPIMNSGGGGFSKIFTPTCPCVSPWCKNKGFCGVTRVGMT